MFVKITSSAEGKRYEEKGERKRGIRSIGKSN